MYNGDSLSDASKNFLGGNAEVVCQCIEDNQDVSGETMLHLAESRQTAPELNLTLCDVLTFAASQATAEEKAEMKQCISACKISAGNSGGDAIRQLFKGLGDCLSLKTLVRTDSGTLPVGELQVGDLVLSADGQLERVTAFMHYSNHIPQTFIRLYHGGKDGNIPVDLTAEHVLFRGDGASAFAQEMNVGDRVRLCSGEAAHITRIEIINTIGFSAPLTSNGELVCANGMVVSCFAYILDVELAKMALQPLMIWSGMRYSPEEGLHPYILTLMTAAMACFIPQMQSEPMKLIEEPRTMILADV